MITKVVPIWSHIEHATFCRFIKKSLLLFQQTSPTEKAIRRDITRTYPDHSFFKQKNGLGQESLFNVMKVKFKLLNSMD